MFTGSVITNSFRLERNQGVHNLLTDTLKMALYTSAATLDRTTTAYSATNEVSDVNYTAGGATITGVTQSITGDTLIITFDAPTWNPATFTARGGLLYNSTHANKSIFVYDFGQDRTGLGKFIMLKPSNGYVNEIGGIAIPSA